MEEIQMNFVQHRFFNMIEVDCKQILKIEGVI